MTMFALLYLLFLGFLGSFLFSLDLIRWSISRFQLPNWDSNELEHNPNPRATIYRRQNFLAAR
jgi:hypothetical protein